MEEDYKKAIENILVNQIEAIHIRREINGEILEQAYENVLKDVIDRAEKFYNACSKAAI